MFAAIVVVGMIFRRDEPTKAGGDDHWLR